MNAERLMQLNSLDRRIGRLEHDIDNLGQQRDLWAVEYGSGAANKMRAIAQQVLEEQLAQLKQDFEAA